MSDESLKAELERLREENAALKKGAAAAIRMKVSEKGALSVYGMGRFPVTLYKEQWLRLLNMSEEVRAFIAENEAQLKAPKNSGSEDIEMRQRRSFEKKARLLQRTTTTANSRCSSKQSRNGDDFKTAIHSGLLAASYTSNLGGTLSRTVLADIFCEMNTNELEPASEMAAQEVTERMAKGPNLVPLIMAR